MTSFLGFLTLCAGFAVTSAADWSYSAANGIPPDQWGTVSSTCDHNSQSPINVFEGDVTDDITDAIVYQNYDNIQNLLMNLTNNGHSAVVSLGGTSQPSISGGGLGGTFQAVQFHFHWGSQDSQGSEHEVNGQAFPMELHIVHYNTKYADITAALSHPDGLAVLGFFYEVSANDNAAYSGLVSSLGQLQAVQEGVEVVVDPMTLDSLLPATHDRFFRYAGSLTTPDCQEAVTWTVFKDTIKISEQQLKMFRGLASDDNVPLEDNYRPVQDYNGRMVTSNFDTHIHWGYKPPKGPEHWSDYYQACGGVRQSPINYPASASSLAAELTPFTFIGYDRTEGISMTLKNNGHSAKVEIAGGLISVNGSDLDEPFVADQFHFHWGKDSTRGSEHHLDSRVFPMELHIVHHRESLGSLSAAASVPEGLAVLGFFFTVSANDNPAFEDLITGLASVQTPGAELPITTMTLDSLLPANRADYYRYSGSLTTPACYASVKWVLFQDTINISETQLAAFRALIAEEDNMAMVDNFRPVQLVSTSSFRRSFQLPATPHWSYAGAHGASHWEELFSSCSSLSTAQQSPVDIVLADVVHSSSIPPIQQVYKQANYDFINNGHAVQASVEAGSNLTITPTDDVYELSQFHFHWGTTNAVGSEHLIDSVAFPMEIHLVHYNKRYDSVGIAATQANGLAVLGIMVEVSAIDNPALKPIVDQLDRIKSAGANVAGVAYDVSTLLPSRVDRFYRYQGSLTTPLCHESVLWTVFDEPIGISQAQLDKFREVLSGEQDPVTGSYTPIENNFRPVQPLNSRVVHINFALGSSRAGPSVSQVSSILNLPVFGAPKESP